MLHKYNNKTVARKAYNEGETVLLQPCQVAPNNGWVVPMPIHKDDQDGIKSSDFDTRVNHFEAYNCTYETGYYTSFYVEVKVDR